MSRASALARRGEAAAAGFLERQGLEVLERNWRGRSGELDLICQDRGTLVFVEVKTRSSARHGSPEESVGPRKLERLYRVAGEYLAVRHARGGHPEPPCRFDLVAVETRSDGSLDIRHMPDLEPA